MFFSWFKDQSTKLGMNLYVLFII